MGTCPPDASDKSLKETRSRTLAYNHLPLLTSTTTLPPCRLGISLFARRNSTPLTYTTEGTHVMDSMRHLSTSLPPTRRRRQQDAPELLNDFRAAALSVTNLYKSAAASQEKARAAGYQDALDDLLAFLDKENLGLMDGEGWRVRQFATERLIDDGSAPGQQQQKQGSDEEVEDEGQAQQASRADSRSSSPEMQRKAAVWQPDSSELGEETIEAKRTATSEPPQLQLPSHPPTSNAFTFRSSTAYPSNHDREGTMDVDASTTHTSPPESSPASVRLIPRNRARHAHGSKRAGNNPTHNFNLGSGAGSKRKMPYPDFFDISGFNIDGSNGHGNGSGGKEGRGGGGKRGKHV